MIGAISPSNKFLGAEKLFSQAITIWDIATTKELKTLSPKFKNRLKDVVFSKSDKYIGVTSIKEEFVIWEIDSEKEIYRGKKEKKQWDKYFEPLQIPKVEGTVP